MNITKLAAVMKEHGETQAMLANAMGISPSRLSAKINGYRGAEFRQGEINFVRQRYNLNAEDTSNIFFDHVVS